MTASRTAVIDQSQAAVLDLTHQLAATVDHITDPAEAAQALYLDILDAPYTREALAMVATLLAVRLHRAAEMGA